MGPNSKRLQKRVSKDFFRKSHNIVMNMAVFHFEFAKAEIFGASHLTFLANTLKCATSYDNASAMHPISENIKAIPEYFSLVYMLCALV